MNTAVVCLGNELVRDDGVAIRIARVLDSIALPPDVHVLQRSNLGLELIELLEEFEQIVVVDAMTGGCCPGACHVIELEHAEKMAVRPGCSHAIGIPEIVQLARVMFPARPLSSIRIVAVEAESMDTFGVGLSEAVLQALPRAVDLVLQVVGAPPRTRATAREAAIREAQAPRGVGDVLGARQTAVERTGNS